MCGCLRIDHPRWKLCRGGLLGRTELPIPRYLSDTNFTLEPSLRPVGCLSARTELTVSQAGSVQSTNAAAADGAKNNLAYSEGPKVYYRQF